MIDIHTIGAGGGSIAYVDNGGAFRVGPKSAGADPGPAAYGKGGIEPTVTDANLVLGRLDPDNFLGGAMPLDLAAARGCRRAGRAARPIARKGRRRHPDHRQRQYGERDQLAHRAKGAGSAPICTRRVRRRRTIARAEVARVSVFPGYRPAYPGITSAVGLLTTDLKYDSVRTEFQVGDR